MFLEPAAGMLNDKADIITWLNIGIKTYNSYFAVHSISNPVNRKIVESLTEYEAIVLQNVLFQVIKMHKANDAERILKNV